MISGPFAVELSAAFDEVIHEFSVLNTVLLSGATDADGGVLNASSRLREAMHRYEAAWMNIDAIPNDDSPFDVVLPSDLEADDSPGVRGVGISITTQADFELLDEAALRLVCSRVMPQHERIDILDLTLHLWEEGDESLLDEATLTPVGGWASARFTDTTD